jgi:hypothetical protein
MTLLNEIARSRRQHPARARRSHRRTELEHDWKSEHAITFSPRRAWSLAQIVTEQSGEHLSATATPTLSATSANVPTRPT